MTVAVGYEVHLVKFTSGGLYSSGDWHSCHCIIYRWKIIYITYDRNP